MASLQPPAGAVAKKLDLLKQRLRQPFVSIAIPSWKMLKNLASRAQKTDPAADEAGVVVDKITTAVAQELAATGHQSASWTLQTPDGADTEVLDVAMAICEHLETTGTDDLEVLVNTSKLQEGTISMPIRVAESTGCRLPILPFVRRELPYELISTHLQLCSRTRQFTICHKHAAWAGLDLCL